MNAPATIGELAVPVAPVGPETICESVARAFANDPALYVIPVVDGDVPIGLLNRFKFLERLSSRFGRALTVTRSVAQFMERTPLILDESTPIDRVGELFVAADNPYVFDGFVVTRAGRYVAIGTGLDLMRALADRRHSELLKLAQHDTLTGLPNRHQFDLKLQQALDHGLATSSRVALLFIDLDRFKRINDTFGHRVGDLVLCAQAVRLRANIRRHDTAARLGGDEFAVILQDVMDGAAADMVASTLLEACSAPLQIEGHDIVVSCSIGVATCPEDARTADRLVQAADAAVYNAKQVRNTHQRYRPDMSPGSDGPIVDLTELRHVIDRGLLTVHYQPKIDLRSDRICGVEALVRWPHPTRGMIPTDELVRLAEDAGLIIPISEFVIQRAMRDLQDWSAAIGNDDLHLAVNISSVQLRHDGLLTMLNRLVAAAGFDCRRLELELTESTAMLAGRSAAATLRALKERGFVLAIDDFGTGYSSLSQLERMPVDVLKIDRSFISGIGNVARDGAIAKAIIALGHSLGLTLVAEGVETMEELAFLRREGCDIAQGCLFGRPMPAADMLNRLGSPVLSRQGY